jgi:predicted O-linked N-acetylglucosamine transferase (SPINDLY family)
LTLEEALARADELVKAGNLAGAEAAYRAVLEGAPDHVEALTRLAAIEIRLGRRHRAVKLLERGLALKPRAPALHLELGGLRASFGDHAAAVQHFAKAIEFDPERGEGYAALARSFFEQGRFRDAEATARRGLALDARLVEARHTLGRALAAQGRMAEAADAFRAVVAAQPQSAVAHMHLGNALEDPVAAADSYARALALDPGLRPLHCLIGEATRRAAGDAAALPHLRRAVELVPADAGGWALLGAALRRTERDEAVACLERALALDGRHLGALVHQIEILQGDGAFEAASAAFERLLAALPDRIADERTWQTLAALLHLDAHRALPRALADAIARQLDAVLAGRVRAFGALPARAHLVGAKLRLGYLSAHFGDHPIGHVTVSLFASHDREIFEVHGFSLRDRSVERQPFATRLSAGFDRLHDLSRHSPRAAAAAIGAADIDILIDLDGYTGHHSPEVLAYRPAPLQVSMIGHLSGLNLGCVDYLITDQIVVPPGEEGLHREQVVRLPVTLHPADRHAIATPPPSRARCGLPATGFVFGGFARPDKLDAVLVACWLRILAAVDRSVLWLSAASPAFEASLRDRATAAGVDPARLVFAARLDDKADHLARYGRCDLLLDTQNFNAASTALDALWAGVPMLALKGGREYSRVSASLLGALGLPELVCESSGEYEKRAVALAQAPAELAALRAKLARQRETAPLFDIAAYARALEAAFAHMWARRLEGAAPRGFALAPTRSAPRPPDRPAPKKQRRALAALSKRRSPPAASKRPRRR